MSFKILFSSSVKISLQLIQVILYCVVLFFMLDCVLLCNVSRFFVLLDCHIFCSVDSVIFCFIK